MPPKALLTPPKVPSMLPKALLMPPKVPQTPPKTPSRSKSACTTKSRPAGRLFYW
jgi:hypothetical protein